jgi:hypothetical protein
VADDLRAGHRPVGDRRLHSAAALVYERLGAGRRLS